MAKVIDEALDSLEHLLDSSILDEVDSDYGGLLAAPQKKRELIDIVYLQEGEIDPRLKLLSHSSRQMLHSCPRKYQLYRLNSLEREDTELQDRESHITFAYGKVVGLGMQLVLANTPINKLILELFTTWDTDLLAENPRQHKSFWLALWAVKRFSALHENGLLKDYELMQYEGKPAVELSFSISMPNGYFYRGFVDAVLKHKTTGELLILEGKTTSGKAQSAMYKNSGQAVGYSVVLDKLAPEASSYTVLYLVYETKTYEYVEFPFKKSLLQRALWLQELLIDTRLIDTYEEYGVYPMHGESCYDFYRDCEYLSMCTLSTQSLVNPLTKGILERLDAQELTYQFRVSFYDLVEAQLLKGELDG